MSRTHEQTCCLYFGLHICHLELCVLELCYAATELFTLFGVFYGFVHSSLCYAESLSRYAYASAVEGLHRNGKTLALLSEQVLFRYTAVFEDKLCRRRAAYTHLLLFLADREAGRTLLDDEGRYAFVAKRLVGHRKNNVYVGIYGIGDENLVAVEHVLVAVEYSRCLLHGGVCARIRLCQPECTYPLARGETWQVFHFLLLCAVFHNRGTT